MKRAKNKSGIYDYLDSIKVLESGTEQEISQAREKYWREYKARWRKSKRKSEKEICTTWNGDELNVLTKEAKRHKQSRTKFIKSCTHAYINKSYIIPNQSEVRRISQLLAITYNSIREMIDENTLPFHTGKILSDKILQLEREVLVSLYNPKTLQDFIIDEIHKDASFKIRLYQFLQTI